MPLIMVGPLLDLMAPVPNLLHKLGGSQIVFSPDKQPARECCLTHFTDEETKARC